MIGLVAVMLVLVYAPMAMTAEASEDTQTTAKGDRFVVGFETFPRGLEPGDTYKGGTVTSVNQVIGFAVVKSENPSQFKRDARADKNTEYVEEDPVKDLLLSSGQALIPHATESLVGQEGDLDLLPDRGPGVTFTPNDPDYTTKQYGPQQIRADLAWDTTLGGPDAAVCIVDTGVRYTHEDLQANWAGGHDFYNGDSDPWDDNGHGTHVAGIAAAVINNGVGIAGIANVDIYGVKVLSSSGSGFWSDVADGITWCADNTKPNTVISMSLGGSSGSTAVANALDYAYNTKGKLVVAAAGNSGSCTNCISYPAKYTEAIAVTCTDSSESQCWFSSQGPESELAAPGMAIYSTYNGHDSDYTSLDGTSMSTPHVSGAAALAWDCDSGLSNTALRSTLQSTAQDLGSAGHDNIYGYGEVDAKNLIDAVSCGGGGGPLPLPFFEDFDDGSADGWSLSGLWRVTSCRSASSPNSLGYNQGSCPPDFDVGTTSGSAITPALSLPSGSTIEFTWDSWHDTESGTTYDKKLVQISTDGGSTWTTLHQEDGTQQTWNARSLDLSAYAGQTVELRFHFNSVDGIANTGEGWYVDNVHVKEITPAVWPLVEDFDDGSADGWGLSGLWHVSNCRSASSPNSLAYNEDPCPPDYDVGTTAGNAITPDIAIPSWANPILVWDSWHETESGTTWDKKLVQVSADGGSTWTTVWQEDGTQQTWNDRSVDLSAYTGQTVKIKFRFNSVDSVLNNMEGWYVDNVVVDHNNPPSACFTTSPSSGIVLLTTFSFDASCTTDDWTPSSSILVRWDFENDGTWDTGWSTTKTTSHTYSTPGVKTIRLQAMDGQGLTDTTTRTVTVQPNV